MQSDVTYAIDWDGDSLIDQTVVGPAGGLEVSHRFENTGDYTFNVTATDKDGDTGPAAQHSVSIIDSGTAFIGGYVYLDVNNNGIKDAAELALPNVPISLSGDDDRMVFTDANGWYEFSDLPPGQYHVQETIQPAAFLDGQDTLGEPEFGHCGNDIFYEMQLPSMAVAMHYNFGEMGLIPELVSKRFFLASTPDGQELLAMLAAESGEGWFTFPAETAGEFIVNLDASVQGLKIELYTDQMMPIALSQGEHLLAASVMQGENYVLHIAGETQGDSLQASLAIKPRTPVISSDDRVLDVNADGWISPLDALLVINQLNSDRNTQIIRGDTRYLLDVNADDLLSPIDALLVINYLNQRDMPEGEPLDGTSVTDPASAEVGVSPAATRFYVVDALSDAAFRYTSDGTSNGQLATGQEVRNARGVTSNLAGDRIWVVEGDRSGRVLAFGSDGEQVDCWYAAGTVQPEGLATDGTDIWLVDASLREILHYPGAAAFTGGLTASNSFALHPENVSPTGLATDGNVLWVCDDVRDAVFVYSAAGDYLGHWLLDASNADPSGITNNPAGGSNLWVVDREDLLVYEYEIGCDAVSPGQQRPPPHFHSPRKTLIRKGSPIRRSRPRVTA